jgi:hypothetical protein
MVLMKPMRHALGYLLIRPFVFYNQEFQLPIIRALGPLKTIISLTAFFL